MIHTGDCVEVMAGMEPESVDAIVTDPPYSIGFMGRKWDQHPDEDAAFGYWLAGFTDGEGHFRVQAQSRGTYSCAFSIHLRRDDRAILERIRRFLGVGSVLDEKDTGERNPMSKLTVQSKGDCLRVVEVFTRYPLRAKKLRDFLPWAEAVFEWNGMQRGHRWSGRGDWRRLEALKARVESARAFREMPWSGHGYQDWSREWGELALRVLRPGGYLLAMGGTRTYHRMTAGLEDAGFQIRDCLVYGYASGFPKSKASLKPAWEPIVMARKPGPLRDLAIDACRIPADAALVRPAIDQRDNIAYGQGLGVGVQQEPGGRWPANVILTSPIFDGGWEGVVGGGETSSVRGGWKGDPAASNGPFAGIGGVADDVRDSGTYSRFFSIPITMGVCRYCGVPIADESSRDGETTATPSDTAPANASSPRKSSSVDPAPSVANRSVEAGGDIAPPSAAPLDVEVSGSNPEPSTTNATASGLWNEHEATTPSTRSGKPRATSLRSTSPSDPATSADRNETSSGTTTTTPSRLMCESCADLATAGYIPDAMSTGRRGSREVPADSEGYTRFLIIPKADRADREPVLGGLPQRVVGPTGGYMGSEERPDVRPGRVKHERTATTRANHHPTVKPTDLMRHLVRLVTPAGGTVLDPFLGSGTTAIAAEMEGFSWIGIEREAEYVAIAEARLNGVQKGLGLSA